MNPSEIESTFASGQKLPEPIVDICRFLSVHGYPISGCFEISKIGMFDVKAWFKKNESAQAALLPFGRGACGDVYAIWLTDDLSPEEAPVIMLGSEGQLEVLASSPREFCRLLCLGYSEIGSDDPSSPPTDYEETKAFRDFMQQKYHFDLPQTADLIIQAAQTRFPNFAQWVETNQE
jgi:hypothetical protein